MRSFSLVSCAFALASAAAAQGTFVVPSRAANNEPGAVWSDSAPQSYPLWGTSATFTSARAQYLYAVSDIPIATGSLTAMHVRAPASYSIPAGTYQTTIGISMGPNAPTQASRTFSSNHGASPATVFSGALNMPAESNGPWPRTWQVIPFAQPAPYLAAGGQSLVVDFQTTSSSNRRIWMLEGMRAEYGTLTAEYTQSSCSNSAGRQSSRRSWDPTRLVPGGVLDLILYDYPPNTPSLATNALFIGLQGRGAQFGPFVTPFPLVNLGLPAPALCEWAIDIVGGTGLPMQYTASAGGLSFSGTTPAIPNTPSIAGSTFYAQNIALDVSPTGGPSLFPSVALKWLIGTGNTIPCALVRAVGSSPPATGTVVASEGAVLQFVY